MERYYRNPIMRLVMILIIPSILSVILTMRPFLFTYDTIYRAVVTSYLALAGLIELIRLLRSLCWSISS